MIRTRGQFTISFPVNFNEDAEKILDYSIYAKRIVESYFPVDFCMNFPVRLFMYECPSRASIDLDWRYMRADTNNRHIHFNSPSNAFEYDTQYDEIWYQANIIHEYVHLVVENYITVNTGKDMNLHYPRWFTEGIAGYIPYYHSSSDIFEKYETRLRNVITNIINGDDFDRVSVDVYFGGAILLKYINDQYGQDTIIQIFRSNIFEWESVISNVLNLSYGYFKNNLNSWVRTQY